MALDSLGQAQGSLFMDDGATLNVGLNSLQATFVFTNNTLTYAVQSSAYAPAQKLLFIEIDILGLDSSPTAVTINGQAAEFAWDQQINTISISKLQLPLSEAFQAVLTF